MEPNGKILKNIIFSGGGFKGWAYIGSIRALNERVDFKDIKKVIAVSCGSIFSIFYILQIDYRYILDFFLNQNLKKFMDVNIDSLLTNQSILEGKLLKSMLKELIGSKINPDCNFMELYNQTKINYTILSFNLTDIDIEYFNKTNTPEVKVVDAIMASCAVPLLFPGYIINEKVYYDVGFCNNCPCNLIDPKELRKNTIAFDLASYRVREKYNILTIFNCMTDMLNKHYNKINKKNVFDIIDTRYKNEFMNLKQSKDTIFNIYMNGYKNTLKVLTTFFEKRTQT